MCGFLWKQEANWLFHPNEPQVSQQVVTVLNYMMYKGVGVKGEGVLEPHCLSHF